LKELIKVYIHAMEYTADTCDSIDEPWNLLVHVWSQAQITTLLNLFEVNRIGILLIKKTD
jgi:hypothetical protein